MGKSKLVPLAMVAAAFMLVAAFALGGRGLVAQEMSGTPGPMHTGVHPAHIHEGTCATLGGVVFPLQDVSAMNMMDGDAMMGGTPTAGGEDLEVTADSVASPMPGGMMGQVVAGSTTTVEADLETILGAEHAINVHESAENIQNYIACGDLTGTPTDGELEIELEELNDSGYSGRATLTDNGDGTTTVVVELMMTDGMDQATPTM